MIFDDLDIKSSYDSGKTDVYNDFFNNVLTNSNYYRRFGGLFSAKRFTLIAEGLQNFIKENDGKIELVIIPVFTKDEQDILINGVDENDVITKRWIDDLSKIQEKFLEDHKKALSWLIANNHLTIKLLIPIHNDNTPFTEDELKNHASFRREIGIFFNIENNQPISFHGIIDRDDSEAGELYLIDVSRNWINSEKDQIDKDHEDFTNFWDNDACEYGKIKCKIQPLPKQLKEYFEKIAPKSKSEIPQLKKYPVLRNYQNKAISAWENNGCSGIFEMATGTGKTFTAIGCVKKIELKEDKLLVIIAAPYRNLVDQWKYELSKWSLNSSILEPGIWNQTLRDEIFLLNRSSKSKISILIASHDLFSDEEFVKEIQKCQIPTMLIVDEAHHVGTSATSHGLTDKYQYRLALSATIERYFDQDGTNLLRNYFKNGNKHSTVFTYSLENAIKDKRLCGYNYYPFFVELNSEEFDQYAILTHRAAKLLNSKDREMREKGQILIQQRAKIIRDATNKTNMFKEILGKIPQLKHLLIFCSEKQLDNVDQILSDPSKYCNIDKSIMFRQITYDNPKNKKDRFKILNDFANEVWDVLLSNRVLDEGMDIPQAQNCIILASTGNPTQFIQRRGRVLRIYHDKYKDDSRKTHANIYDILVRPSNFTFENLDSVKLEIGMIRSQLSRITSMGELALNHDECMDKIREFTYNLPTDIFNNL